ncbi:OmpA family protein [Nitrospira sp. Kam-Ns4a]
MALSIARLKSVLFASSLLILAAGCTGRQLTSSAEDQAFVPGPPVVQATPPPAPAPVVEAEAPTVASKEEPPAPIEAARIPDAAPPVEERVQPEPIPEPAAPPTPEAAAPPQEARAPEPEAPPAPTLQPRTLTLSDAFFDFDAFAIREDAKAALEHDAQALRSTTNWKLLIEGHCDERGTADYNLVLGERRAQAVQRYLANLGLEASRIQITSYGKERPFCQEHSTLCWQENRRAHFVVRQ